MIDTYSRAFVGVKLPQAASTALAEIQMTLRKKVIADLRWNDPNQFVLTLCPLGDTVTIDKLAMLPGMIEPSIRGCGPITLTLEGLEGLPNNVQPRYVCMKLGGNIQRLTTLQGAIQRVTGQLTGPQECRGFQPHIVLGRLKKESEPERVALGRGMRLMAAATAGEFTMDSVSLIRNTAADGVSYEVMKSIPL